MKIAVYTIAKNEEANIDEWAASCFDADYAVVCDTGSTDGTFEKFHKHVDYIWKITVDPWRFDTAHNVALALVPADADLCIPLHLDERLTDGWRARIETAWEKGARYMKGQRDGGKAYGSKYPTSLLYPYKYDATTTFMQNRIHARKGYIWRYPTHEGIFPYFDTQELQAKVAGNEPLIVQIDAEADRREGRGDLQLLQWGMQENPGDVHVMWYLGRQLMLEKRWGDAAEVLRNFLAHPTVMSMRHQRDAARFLSLCYHNLGGNAGDVP